MQNGAIRVLVVGVGNMGLSHALAYDKIEGFELVGLCSRSIRGRNDLPAELASLPRYENVDEALADAKPDAVSINTYPNTHEEFCIKAFDAGCHVFVEKPLATTVEGAQRVVDKARETGKKLVIGYILRVHPAWTEFIARARTLGKPLVMRMNLNQQSRGPAWNWHRNLMESLTPIVDCGVHYVDVMCQMTGAQPVRVHGIGAQLTDQTKVQNYGHLHVEFDDGSVKAQISPPNMVLPIQYALLYPDRVYNESVASFDPVATGGLTFEPWEAERYPLFQMALEVGRRGGTWPAALSGADDKAVEMFLAGRIGFLDIGRVIEAVLDRPSERSRALPRSDTGRCPSGDEQGGRGCRDIVDVFDLPSWLLVFPILGFLVLVHEAAHFATAKWFGARVTEFGIGFPPRLLGARFGETLYSINLIPLGGFVKIVGEEDPTDPRSLAALPRYKRAIVIVSGSAVNLVLPIVIITALFMLPHDTIEGGAALITGVAPRSPAAEAGLRAGDAILQRRLPSAEGHRRSGRPHQGPGRLSGRAHRAARCGRRRPCRGRPSTRW